MRKETKKFIGGAVIGVLVGAIIGGFTVAIVMGTAFVNYELKKVEVGTLSQMIVSQHK